MSRELGHTQSYSLNMLLPERKAKEDFKLWSGLIYWVFVVVKDSSKCYVKYKQYILFVTRVLIKRL